MADRVENSAGKGDEQEPTASARGSGSGHSGLGSGQGYETGQVGSPSQYSSASDGSSGMNLASNGASGGAKDFARDAASAVGIGKSHSLFTLIVVSLTAGTVIVAYVLFVGWYIIRKNQSDTIKLAALQAARDLSDIVIQSPTTGAISLCNWRSNATIFSERGESSPRTVGSLRRTYAKIRQVAEMTHVKVLERLASEDEQAVAQQEKELRRRLDESIIGGAFAATMNGATGQPAYSSVSNERVSRAPMAQGRVLQRVRDLIIHRYALNYGLSSMSLDSVKIRLGYLEQLPAVKSSSPIFLINSAYFKEAPPDRAPNLVLVESRFKVQARGSGPATFKEKRECACLKPLVEEPPAAALVMTFPQGIPPIATSLLNIINFSHWSTGGLWHQAVGGDVPGNGRLAPPLFPSMPEMTPGNALAIELYHWLKYCGEGIDPGAVAQMLLEPWSERVKRLPPGDVSSFGVADEQINSCLVNDTGSRENALIYESNKGEIGQRALAKALLIRVSQQSYAHAERPAVPQSAFPLLVNSAGECRIIEANDFNSSLLRDFLNGLYRTNLAANETIASLRTMQQVTNTNVQTLEQKLSEERQEFLSLSREILKAKYSDGQLSNGKVASQKRFLQDRIDDLKIVLQQNQDQLNQNQHLLKLMDSGLANASRAAMGTFELCAHKFRYCRDGLVSMDNGFLIGKNLAFKPLDKTVSLQDLYETLQVSEGATGPSGGAAWLSRNLNVVGTAERVFPQLNLKSVHRQPVSATYFLPRMLIVDSRDIQEGKHAKNLPFIQIFNQYPFANISLPESELVYYCQDALTTGKKPEVTWSVLARDLLANRGHQAEGRTTLRGLPVRAENNSWCQESMFGTSTCPGLACEFQIRSPLPKTGDLIENAYLLNVENGERSPLIPPVTPDML